LAFVSFTPKLKLSLQFLPQTLSPETLATMMKKNRYILVILLFSIHLFGQNDSTLAIENKLIEHFKARNWNDEAITRESLYKTNFAGDNFNLSISNNPINFKTEHIVIKNPYFSTKLNNSQEENEYTRNFPSSFSVIYQDNLIALFENGKFVCIELNTLNRNLALEEQLNTRKFSYHWIIDHKLIAQGGNKKMFWNGKKWEKYKEKLPPKNQPILFDDKDFIVYRACHGEWGGTIYFYEKSTGKTYFTASTCANTVSKTDEGYQVLAHLGHMFGVSEIKLIPDPRKLTETKSYGTNKIVNGQALGYTDKSNAFINKLDLYGIQLFSSFTFEGKELFIVRIEDLTFLAKIHNNEVELVHPLFFNDLYTHQPITTKFGTYTLVNIDHYGTGLYREISTLILHKNTIKKIDWNENHNR